ncbi:MAG: DNA integrity scanning protein DisA nucleotide-binding domain protein [Candidatus Paceibacteria bacterium]
MKRGNFTKDILITPVRISGRILRKFFRVAEALSKFRFLTKSEQEILLNVLTHSEDGAPPELKIKIYQVLKRLIKRLRHPFGMIIVLGWKKEWEKRYAALPDATQNIFENRSINIAQLSEEKLLEELSKTADFDGAILINSQGEIVASGIYLENMKPSSVADRLYPARAQDLSTSFGFKKKVHARHLAAISASYWLKGSTVFVVSEEDRSIRIFEGGRIIWSTIKKEIHKR